jgi:hypothetical protein
MLSLPCTAQDRGHEPGLLGGGGQHVLAVPVDNLITLLRREQFLLFFHHELVLAQHAVGVGLNVFFLVLVLGRLLALGRFAVLLGPLFVLVIPGRAGATCLLRLVARPGAILRGLLGVGVRRRRGLGRRYRRGLAVALGDGDDRGAGRTLDLAAGEIVRRVEARRAGRAGESNGHWRTPPIPTAGRKGRRPDNEPAGLSCFRAGAWRV